MRDVDWLFLLFLLCLPDTSAAAAVDLRPCGDADGAQQSVRFNCSWGQLRPAAQAIKVFSPTAKLSLVLVDRKQQAKEAVGPAAGEFHLSLERLVLAGVKLTSPADASAPQLWPQGLFDTVGSGLNITDVRLMVDAADLKEYVAHMQTLPRSIAQYYTDGMTFLHIAAWKAGKSNIFSTTLISGACLAPDATAYADFADAMGTAAVDGCNVRAVNNASLIPTLLNYGSLPTPEPLLVLITANVSLGFGLKPGAIPIHRPVVMVGAYSVPTSIDMYMVVNQLNVTSKYAKIYFLSLFIENAAPGDAISSLLSRPMSSAVSANVYAVYCDRLRNCLNLHNSTVVLASQQEMDYLNYMYSMFNSPLPNMRQATAFYHTELRCVVILMGPGPNGVGMTLYNLTCGAWDLYNSVFTTQPAVAERLPFPEGAPQITAATKAGPLVQSVRDCNSLQESMKFRTVETRLHVWMLLDNIDLVPDNDPNCWHNRSILYPTQIYGRPYESAESRHSASTFSFAFGYLQNALVLPDTVDNRFLSIMNTTLTELPQGPDPHATPPPGRLAPDVLTILVWSVSRNMAAVDALYLQDVSMWLPRPEYDFFAERAAASSSFAVQLMGSDDLTLKGTAVANGVVKIQTLDGPGMMGFGIELRPMQAGQLPPNYFWPNIPADSFTAPVGQGLAAGQVAGIVLGSFFGVLCILAATYLAWRARRHKHHEHYLLPAKPALDTQSQGSSGPGPGCRSCGHNSNSNSQLGTPNPMAPCDGGFTFVAVDVASARDVLPPLPAGPVVHDPTCVGSDSQPSAGPPSAGLGSSGTNGSTNAGSLPSGAVDSSAARSSSSDSISLGLDRWKAAISTTTMQLMERRMQMTSSSCSSSSVRASSGGSSSRQNRTGPGNSRAQARAASCGSSSSQAGQQGLQIHQLIGQGSFGSVWLGTWHNKRVAIKIMQLPASCPFAAGQEAPQPAALMAQNQANSPPHMAIMEAVLSSTVSHPNVVQVYTYMVNPLGVGGNGDGGQQRDNPAAAAAAAGPAAPSAGLGAADAGKTQQQSFSKITGWELRIVMEYCNSGTLREALDRRTLHGPGIKYLPREGVVCLCHDIAGALLHLHSQGVIHGDLKAANVMLTQGGDDQEGVWAPTFGHRVTAKVADFGLALPLDPADTHATLAARGTPTHMSPELFMSGHVSKASDVYALGILLHELISGHRAYQGVPIPLLPHEVAVKGLRPKWPTGLPEEYRDLQSLAEACWAPQPQDRPTITDIFEVLCRMVREEPVSHLLPRYQQVQPSGEEQDEQQQLQQQAPDLDVAHSPPGRQAPQQAADAASPSQAAAQHSAAVGNGTHTAGRRNMSWSEVKPAGLLR